jgi:hypothetical protein
MIASQSGPCQKRVASCIPVTKPAAPTKSQKQSAAENQINYIKHLNFLKGNEVLLVILHLHLYFIET